MSFAAALLDTPAAAEQLPDSYAGRARRLVLCRPELFLLPGGGGGFSGPPGPPVQPASRRPDRVRLRRRGGRQLSLPLASPPPGKLP